MKKLLACLALVGFVLTGCTPDATSTPAGTPTPQKVTPPPTTTKLAVDDKTKPVDDKPPADDKAKATDVNTQNWGTVKGQVVWAGGAVPAPAAIQVNKDQGHCLSKGQISSDELVVDKKTLGVKNVMVWLAPIEGKIPIHPNLAAVPKEKVLIDQPCCMFVPRITMMREGQILEVNNPAPVLHNARITGSTQVNSTINLSIPPGQKLEKTLKAEKKPLLLGCDVHGWMGGRIGVFNHPYFALTKEDGTFEIKNAPVGKFKIYIQHEKIGWLHKQTGEKLSDGQEITIPGSTLDLGKIDMKP